MNQASPPLSALRLKLTITAVFLCVVLGSSYVLYASQRTERTVNSDPMPVDRLTSLDVVLGEAKAQPNQVQEQPLVVSGELTESIEAVGQVISQPNVTRNSTPTVLAFINRFAGKDFGRVGVTVALHPDKLALTDLRCARMYIAAGSGICLQTTKESQGSDALVILFNDQFEETRRYYLLGSPSRARVSRDGAKAAYTAFVAGHSYNGGVGSFSTDTRIVDMQRDYRISLEDFKAYRNGEPFQHIDFNYWGVTFANDSNRFYATLGTQGKSYIVKGNVQTQTVEVITEGGECPSISPDNRHLVFKERSGGALGAPHFQLVSYALEDGKRTVLGEMRSVDDQIEWLDNDTILYAMPDAELATQPTIGLWALNISPNSKPQLYLNNAESPAVVVW